MFGLLRLWLGGLSAGPSRSRRAVVVGMLYAYNLLVRVVLGSETDPRGLDDYDNAVGKVRADLVESTAYWDPLISSSQSLLPLARYYRLTKVQQARPDVPELADMRAQALADEDRTGGWTYRALTDETGLSLGRIQQLMDRAGV